LFTFKFHFAYHLLILKQYKKKYYVYKCGTLCIYYERYIL